MAINRLQLESLQTAGHFDAARQVLGKDTMFRLDCIAAAQTTGISDVVQRARQRAATLNGLALKEIDARDRASQGHRPVRQPG